MKQGILFTDDTQDAAPLAGRTTTPTNKARMFRASFPIVSPKFGERIMMTITTTTTKDIQAEALSRATGNQSIGNWPAIFAGFTAKGIPESDIRPRENIFTYQHLERR